MVEFYNEYTFVIGILAGWMSIGAWEIYNALKEHYSFKSHLSGSPEEIEKSFREFSKGQEICRHNPDADRYFYLSLNKENDVKLEIVKDKAEIEKVSSSVNYLELGSMYVVSPYRKMIDYSMYVKQ